MTIAAEKVVVPAEKKDEKVEKRRALGRGLESLLPGPRVVTNPGPEPRAPIRHMLVRQRTKPRSLASLGMTVGRTCECCRMKGVGERWLTHTVGGFSGRRLSGGTAGVAVPNI